MSLKKEVYILICHEIINDAPDPDEVFLYVASSLDECLSKFVEGESEKWEGEYDRKNKEIAQILRGSNNYSDMETNTEYTIKVETINFN